MNPGAAGVFCLPVGVIEQRNDIDELGSAN